jgi:thioesterase domain-containing protein
LRIDRVGRHDNFHLLGGDSLGALRLCSAIHTEFGIDLPPGELLRSPTIAQLAARVDQGPAASSSSVILLRPGHGGTPLYLPPSMGGELLYWRDLVRTLDSGRPIYGFSVPIDTSGPVNLQKVAATMVRDLVSFQPDGPYHLAGYSFSAALAFEMAQQLRASGRVVGVLAMIDYGPGSPASALTRLRTIGHFLSNLPNWLRDDVLRTGWASLAGRVRRKLSAWTDRVAQLGRSNTAQNAERAYAQMFDHQDVPDARRRLAIDHLDAFYRYEPVPYDGNVLLFWARCRPLFHSLSPSLGWEHYAVGGYERITVACNHDNILKAPHVKTIATVLDRALAAESSPLSRRK